MIYFKTGGNGAVVYQNFMPFDPVYGLGKTEAELLETGYLVESIPGYSGEIPEGKMPELHYDGATFSWVMVDKPASPEDQSAKIAALEARIAELEAVNAAQLGLEETV